MVPPEATGAQPSQSPSPVLTRHSSHLPPFPTNELLGSIASGAHYAGALKSHPDDPPMHARLWRARSRDRSGEDPTVELKYHEVIEDLQKLYDCHPTLEIIKRRFREDASVEHPLFKCVGIRDITALLFALTRFITSSERVSTRILTAGLSPNRLTFIHTQRYTLRLMGTKKEITSVVFLDLDDDMRIVQLTDQWNGEEHATRWGAESLRRLFGKILSWSARVPEEHDRQ
ncbi:hypothetical protein L226DRAFT_608828 [Lentinus tigrinus ALCF2SS1-7]|uniref:Uncharacterized protein n=1 Tax=Lentinus tigrinus ALCF2SS1-6 TaxID=1328759 RepID=A0A5C2SRC6_9APHY|nr:hypothetical protein L227DRAFT_648713 [Lentinus tigrinus ALCF2SS1-6]RPD79824.1 hypothetical protein L226DRAFT_608828 [Lentinus tigrinus ALCF2SS1-7]